MVAKDRLDSTVFEDNNTNVGEKVFLQHFQLSMK